MARRMADPAFRAGQEHERYASHIRSVNEFVDSLRSRGRGWVPYVAPCHGGAEARMLSVLRDPGPKTQDGTGSGFLCIENDDPTAELQSVAFAAAGIANRDFTPWNAYPWYINRKPTRAELDAGVDVLFDLLALLPRVEVVLLQGGDAQRAWRRLLRRHPDLRTREFEVLNTYHPSRQALRTPDPAIRAARQQARLDTYAHVARSLGLSPSRAV